MSAKHTIGPWQLCAADCSPPEIIAPGMHDICVMQGGSSHPGVMADARLIAAAPELLDAEVLARDLIGPWLSAALEDESACAEFKRDILRWMEVNQNVIAKAIGETE